MNLCQRIYNKRNFIYSYYRRKGGIFDKNLFAKLALHVTPNIFVVIFILFIRWRNGHGTDF